jgi:microsomal dipeptidase-like Zn-dependent dipeptidase
MIDQRPGMDSEITPLGIETIRRLLDKNSGRRILIDIKHMSRQVRLAYYNMLETELSGENIPVVVSHGAVNGYPRLDDNASNHRKRNGLFNGEDINIFDDEIIRVARSGGIFGLQIDRRRITNRWEQWKIKLFHVTKKSKLRRWNMLLWNQIRYIADLLDSNGLPAWDIVCLGTDYDGMVSPIEEYSTSCEIQNLYRNLQYFADDYLRNKNFIIPANRITSTGLLDKVFSENALRFLANYN